MTLLISLPTLIESYNSELQREEMGREENKERKHKEREHAAYYPEFQKQRTAEPLKANSYRTIHHPHLHPPISSKIFVFTNQKDSIIDKQSCSASPLHTCGKFPVLNKSQGSNLVRICKYSIQLVFILHVFRSTGHVGMSTFLLV